MGVRQIFFDDTDPTQEATVTGLAFSIDGKDYEIDLSAENAATLQAILDPFIRAARRSGRGSNVVRMPSTRRAATPAPTRPDKDQLAAMRAWGRKHGFKVSDRGRVSEKLQEAYHNRDEKTGAPAANETAPRDEEAPTPAPTTTEPRYADDKQDYLNKLRAWADFMGYKVSKRGPGVAPSVVKKFEAETGWRRPLETEKAG